VSVVFELEASGFTHVSGRCGGCGETITRSFSDLRGRLVHGALAALADTAPLLACNDCPGASAVELTPIKIRRVPRGGPK
jgi:hypothetical protein